MMQFTQGVVQFRRQFDSRGAAADDGDSKLGQRLLATAATEGQFQHPVAQLLRVVRGVQEHRVLANAGRAEIVRLRAHRQHQPVIGHFARRAKLRSAGIAHFGKLDAAPFGVQRLHIAELELVTVAIAMGEVIDLVLASVERAGGHLVQQRLPDVCGRAVDQHDAGLVLRAQGAPQPGGEFQAAGAAANDDDAG